MMAVAERPATTRLGGQEDDIKMHTILTTNDDVVTGNGDDILEYDEDNVVVIDLTEERNSSSKLRHPPPDLDSDGDGQPKTGELALMREVRSASNRKPRSP